jgi:hypothetical protein
MAGAYERWFPAVVIVGLLRVTVKHLTATLDRFKMVEKERSEVLTPFSSLKTDIVKKINAIEAWCKNAIRTG